MAGPRSSPPSLRIARAMLREGEGRATLAGCDEVGRGALCGPVTVGMVLVTESTRTAPQGVRDSKLLSAEARRRLVPKIQRWAPAWGVGHASPQEIDAYGIMSALRLAGQRALAALAPSPDVVLLDGNHDYLSPPAQEALFGPPPVFADLPPVVTMIKADMRCAAVAAASILAKVTRDEILTKLAAEHPEYGWAENKGYSAPEHMAALAEFGPTQYHRISWNLPGTRSEATLEVEERCRAPRGTSGDPATRHETPHEDPPYGGRGVTSAARSRETPLSTDPSHPLPRA